MIMCVLVVNISMRSFATSYLNNPHYWDSVDTGKHLDYDGSSAYISYVAAGAGRWNNYKSGIIRHDTLLTIQDVDVIDVTGDVNGWAGQSYEGTMYFNTKKMEKLNAIQKTNVASHELGHHLGLGHNQGQNQLSSIMYWKASVYSTLILLSQDDKDSYDYAYDNKY